MTVADVIALAPDPAAVKAAEGLASPRKWLTLQADAAMLWGECQGSGKAPYQVCVDLASLAYRCTCPSRKFPCKHTLAALLAFAGGGMTTGSAPAWAQAWRAEREAKLERAAQRAPSSAPIDDEAPSAAAAKRAQTRERRVEAGLAECDLWLRDIVRLGLAHARIQPPSSWENRAARFVDAQCPGIARRVRAIASIIASGTGWEDRTLAALGDLALLCAAYARIDRLGPELRADVRRAIGWTQTHDEITARAFDVISDEWTIIGIAMSDDDRIAVRRTWLQGAHSGRAALILHFAPRGVPFADALGAPGTCFSATLTYLESATPLRAVLGEREAARTASQEPHGTTIDAALATYARALAGDPWTERLAIVLADVTPLRVSEASWLLRDAHAAVALARGAYDPRVLLAVSGGGPVRVAGEWDGDAFLPLALWADGRVVSIGT